MRIYVFLSLLLRLSISIFLFIFFCNYSYSQENIKNEINKTPKNLGVEFYLDNKKITKEETLRLPKENVLVEVGDRFNQRDTIIRVRYFSTSKGEMAYAKQRSIPLKEVMEVESHLAEYAVSSGAIKAYEKNGHVPKEFIDYQNKYVERKLNRFQFNPRSKLFGMTLSSILFSDISKPLQVGFFGKDHYGGSTRLFSGHSTPIFLFGWKNKISRYHVNWGTFIVYGYFALYDKSFFRKRFYKSWNWTNRMVRFNDAYGLGWANDKAESAFHP